MYFVVNYDYCPFPGLVRVYLLHPMILIMPIKCVSRMCPRYKICSKLCDLSVTDCPILNVH